MPPMAVTSQHKGRVKAYNKKERKIKNANQKQERHL